MPDIPQIRVTPLEGEMGRFHVSSRTLPTKPHLVDLLAHGAQAECTCADWITRCRPNQKAQEGRWIGYGGHSSKNRNRTECRHVHAARAYFLQEILQGLARTHRTEEENKHG